MLRTIRSLAHVQVGPREVRPLQVGAAEVGLGQVAAAQVGHLEVDVAQIQPREVRPAKVKTLNKCVQGGSEDQTIALQRYSEPNNTITLPLH